MGKGYLECFFEAAESPPWVSRADFFRPFDTRNSKGFETEAKTRGFPPDFWFTQLIAEIRSADPPSSAGLAAISGEESHSAAEVSEPRRSARF